MKAALESGDSELRKLAVSALDGQWAADLGAGFGMHSIPLARMGFKVLSIDQCGLLLKQLELQKGTLTVKSVEDDLLCFDQHLECAPSVVLCMNDTITHLANADAVTGLIRSVADYIAEKGRFITTFRDHSKSLAGTSSVIPVRSDRNRVFTCLLEYGDSHVVVNDMLYEWNGVTWDFSTSSYQKLKIRPEWLAQCLQTNGFSVDRLKIPSGMACLSAYQR
ncbi:MAG: hypothetical protein WBS20_04020 [Lysobacterales bacterium]